AGHSWTCRVDAADRRHAARYHRVRPCAASHRVRCSRGNPDLAIAARHHPHHRRPRVRRRRRRLRDRAARLFRNVQLQVAQGGRLGRPQSASTTRGSANRVNSIPGDPMARTLAEHLDPKLGPKRVLALDGGGVKGILTLGMLEVLEAELRRRSGKDDLVLSDYFDLIGGTSTGAIIAAGLGVGTSVGDLITMYRDLGPKVFGKTKGDGMLLGSKYDSKALKDALWPVLDKKRLGSPLLRTGIALHAKR